MGLALPESLASTDMSMSGEDSITVALRSIRTHLGMEIAYVSEFVDGNAIFRQVDAPGLDHLIKVGDQTSLNDAYCQHILAGRLPNLMADTSAIPFAAAMPLTRAVPIGKHMSIPLRLDDGEVYGMFCCLGPQADTSLNDRDLQTMRVFADFAAHEVRRDVERKKVTNEKLQRIADAMAHNRFSTVYQPIYNIQHNRIVGYECLTRFSSSPYRTPDVWFKEADEVGRGATFEIAAIALALKGLEWMPDDIYLGVNASPATIVTHEFAAVLKGLPCHRIVLEVTEHAEVKDYAELTRAIAPLRKRGVRIAIDDAGAGYSGLQHILRLEPNLIKLDLALTRNIDENLARRALASALVNFAVATDSEIIAEGVETASELAALQSLGVQKAQGYYLGRPAPLSDTLSAVEYGAAGMAKTAHQPTPDNGASPQTTMRDAVRICCEMEYGSSSQPY